LKLYKQKMKIRGGDSCHPKNWSYISNYFSLIREILLASAQIPPFCGSEVKSTVFEKQGKTKRERYDSVCCGNNKFLLIADEAKLYSSVQIQFLPPFNNHWINYFHIGQYYRLRGFICMQLTSDVCFYLPRKWYRSYTL
jgi:hypothetical protein